MTMKLSEIFEQLSYGELRQLHIGGAEEGQITEDNYRAVSNHVKLGLTSLYKRFDLKRGRVLVQLMDGMFSYHLQSRYAVNAKGSNAPTRWVVDTVNAPFRDDIIKILAVTSDTGAEFPLNAYADCYSVVTPTMDSIRVPEDVVNAASNLPDQYKTTQLLIDYQANHPVFIPRLGFIDPEMTNIELPATHLQALLYFVASRVYNPIGMGQEFNAGNNWAQRYELECRRLEDDGNEIDQGSQMDRASRNGWV